MTKRQYRALRREIKGLRAEVKALRAELRDLPDSLVFEPTPDMNEALDYALSEHRRKAEEARKAALEYFKPMPEDIEGAHEFAVCPSSGCIGCTVSPDNCPDME